MNCAHRVSIPLHINTHIHIKRCRVACGGYVLNLAFYIWRSHATVPKPHMCSRIWSSFVRGSLHVFVKVLLPFSANQAKITNSIESFIGYSSCLTNGLCVARCLQQSRKGGKRSATGCKVKPWCRQKGLRRVDLEKSAPKADICKFTPKDAPISTAGTKHKNWVMKSLIEANLTRWHWRSYHCRDDWCDHCPSVKHWRRNRKGWESINNRPHSFGRVDAEVLTLTQGNDREAKME